MTDFFDDLERELRRAHRRDTASHARSRVFDRRRLPSLPAPGPQTLMALAAVAAAAWLVAIVLIVGRNSDVERQSAEPRPSPTTAPGEGVCDPGDSWEAPIVDEPIPQAIASRFAIFRDPRPGGEPPREVPTDPQARNEAASRPATHVKRKLYAGALKLRRRLDTGARINIDVTAADVATAQPDRDWCAPPPGPIEPGICLGAGSPSRQFANGKCFTIDEIEDAHAWIGLTPQTVIGLAPDGADRVTFDTPAGTQSLNISGNVFAGEIRSADNPYDTDTRFAP
jgi:hypothetical protein